MPYFIAASPLVKIFLPEWHGRLEKDPDLIYDFETPFVFDIDTGTRSIKVTFNSPMLETDPVLYQWLTGGRSGADSRSTDIYGIVQFDPKIDIVSTFDEMAMLEEFTSDDPKKQKAAIAKREKMRHETHLKIKSARDAVKAASEERIKRHIRFSHNNLAKTWAMCEQMNLGKETPSTAELVGMHAISAEIEASNSKAASLKKRANELMANRVL